jgi:hypothetical protein
MTPAAFRKLALSFDGAVEGEHMGHPDFRVGEGGRIFASLSGGEDGEESGMVRVPLEVQEALVAEHPEVFAPCAGAWGKQGCTAVRLQNATVAILRPAMREAWKLQSESVTGSRKRTAGGSRKSRPR